MATWNAENLVSGNTTANKGVNTWSAESILNPQPVVKSTVTPTTQPIPTVSSKPKTNFIEQAKTFVSSLIPKKKEETTKLPDGNEFKFVLPKNLQGINLDTPTSQPSAKIIPGGKLTPGEVVKNIGELPTGFAPVSEGFDKPLSQSIKIKDFFDPNQYKGGRVGNALADLAEAAFVMIPTVIPSPGIPIPTSWKGLTDMLVKTGNKSAAIGAGIPALMSYLRGENVKVEDVVTGLTIGKILGMANPEPVIKQGADVANARKVLNVSKNATPEMIRSKYVELAKQWHPDVNKSPEAVTKMQQINDAFEALTSTDLSVPTQSGLSGLVNWVKKLWKGKETNKPLQETKLLESGEYTPQQIRDTIINSPLQNTSEGKILIKATFEAEQAGKNIEITSQTQKPVEISKPISKPKSELKLSPTKTTTPEEIMTEVQKVGLDEKGVVSIKDNKTGGYDIKYNRPSIGRSEMKILLTDKEFKANPTLTVAENGNLEFKGEHNSISIVPEALQINRQNLNPGDVIEVDPKSLTGTKQQLRVYKNGEAFASTSDYAKSLENITTEIDPFKIVPFPEMVRLAENLLGTTPVVKNLRARKIGQIMGLFVPGGKGEIRLNPEIFKDPKQASLTLAHEMGHLTDFLPEGSLARGNVLGRIATMRKFLRSSFSGHLEEERIDSLLRRRESLRSQRRDMRDVEGKVMNKEGDKRLLNEVKTLNKEIKAIRDRYQIKNPEIKKELFDLSKKWRPMSKNPSKEVLQYRQSPEELYADAISVLFNDPQRLKLEAPKFTEAFFKYLDKKPKVKQEFFEMQKLLNSSEEEIINKRLDDLSKDYSTGESTWLAKETEKANSKVNLVNILSTLFNDQNEAINRRVNLAIKKGGIIDTTLNPIYDLSGLNYLEGKVKNFVVDNYQPALTIANDVPNGWSELGKILQLERAIYERGELANPRGYNPIEAQRTLDGLQKKLGESDWNKLQKAKEQFRSATQQLISEAEKAGFYKPEIITQMKANPAYATFQVLDYLDTRVSASVMHQKGTLKGIANPATSTVMKAVTTLRAIRYNQSRDVNLKFLEEYSPTEIEKARSRFTGKRQEFLQSRDRTKELVTIVRDGKTEGYYVPKEVAEILNFSSDTTMASLGKVSRMLTQSGVYRPLFTSLNLGFQVFNFAKDFDRSWRNLPDRTAGEAIVSLLKLTKAYGKAVKPAMRRARGIPDELIKQMENNELLGLTRNDLYGTPDPGDEQITRVLQKIGALPIEGKVSTFKKILSPIVKVFDGIELLGNFIETLPKVAGQELVKKPSVQESSYFIRNYIGSPDFRVSGKATPITNNIFLFSNAMKEGIKGDINMAFKQTDTKGAWWFKTTMGTILPKLLQIGIALGVFGVGLKKLMDGVSEYDKTNYDIVILGQDKNGKTIYIRKPKDETGRFIGAMVWKFANTLSSKDKQNLLENLADIFSLWSGQLPSTAPSITGFTALMTYLSGKNPYDPFRNRFVIPDTQFKAGFKYSFPIFIDWLAKNQGLNIVLPSYTPEGQMSSLEKILNLPVLSNILGRFVKVSDYGITEKSNKVASEITQESSAKLSEKKLKVKNAIEEFIKKGDLSEENKQKTIDKLITDVLGHSMETKEDETIAKDVTKRFNMGVLTNKYSAEVDNIITATTNAEKAQGLKYLYENNRKLYDEVYQTLIDEGIISDDTNKKFLELISQAKPKGFSLVKPAYASEKEPVVEKQRSRYEEFKQMADDYAHLLRESTRSKLLSPVPRSYYMEKIAEAKKKEKFFDYPINKLTDNEDKTILIYDKLEIPRSLVYGIRQAEGGKINAFNFGAVDSNTGKARRFKDEIEEATVASRFFSGQASESFYGNKAKGKEVYKKAWENRDDPVKMLKMIEQSGYAGDPSTWKQRSAKYGGAGTKYNSWSEFVMDTPGWKKWIKAVDTK